MASFTNRHYWTRSENEDVLRCYYQSRRSEARGYRARMYELWRNIYPDTPFNEQTVADQALSLLRRKVFTDLELESIRRSCSNGQANTNEEELNSVPSIQTETAHPVNDSESTSVRLTEEASTTSIGDLNAQELALQNEINREYLQS